MCVRVFVCKVPAQPAIARKTHKIFYYKFYKNSVSHRFDAATFFFLNASTRCTYAICRKIKRKFTENDLEIQSTRWGSVSGEKFTTFKLFNKLMELMVQERKKKPHTQQIDNDLEKYYVMPNGWQCKTAKKTMLLIGALLH